MSLRDALDVTFGLAFPLLMIVAPATYGGFVRFRVEGSSDEQAAPRRRAAQLATALWIATAGAAVLAVGLWAVRIPGSQFAWVLFFPLWFGLAWPLAVAKNPNWGVRPTPAVRGARLTPRNAPPPAPRPIFAAGVLLWLVGSALVAVIVARSSPEQGWTLLLSPLGSGAWLAVAGMTYRRSFRESEPLPPQPAPELERAYDDFRLWLRRCFFWFGLAGAAVFTAGGIAAALTLSGQAPIWIGTLIGGGAGTLFGIAGGIVGTVGSLKRVELNRLYREAVAQRPVAGAV